MASEANILNLSSNMVTKVGWACESPCELWAHLWIFRWYNLKMAQLFLLDYLPPLWTNLCLSDEEEEVVVKPKNPPPPSTSRGFNPTPATKLKLKMKVMPGGSLSWHSPVVVKTQIWRRRRTSWGKERDWEENTVLQQQPRNSRGCQHLSFGNSPPPDSPPVTTSQPQWFMIPLTSAYAMNAAGASTIQSKWHQ